MKVSASHTINLGICKLTLSRSGVTVSSGIPFLNVSFNSSGVAKVSASVPGVPGLRYTKQKKLK